MKLMRVGESGAEKPAVLDADGVIRDLSSLIDDLSGAALSPEGLAAIGAADLLSLPVLSPDSRVGVPVGHVGKMVCIGLNYSDHAKEAGMDVPTEPVIFMKATSAISGPFDDVEIPPGSEATDWEVELAAVIGTRAKHISEADAMDHIAGFTIVNDVSERHDQLNRLGQWTKGKSHDTFAPTGPWLVTKDEVGDPQDLGLSLFVNGTKMQDGTTQTMIFSVATAVSYLSRFMTLEPGDIVSTGTPPGVGMGQKPPVYLKPGDVMELSIERLGTQRQQAIAG